MKDIIIGALEHVTLPELNLHNIVVRVDTGAKTSSLHVESLSVIQKDDKAWATFTLEKGKDAQEFSFPAYGIRKVKSSNGEIEQRPVIKTIIKLEKKSWTIQLTLTNREKMRYPMLLGRQAMGSKFLVNPAKDFLLG